MKTYSGFDLRVRLGEWDVNHDVEFFPYIERDVQSVHVHPEYYAGTLDNDLAILKLSTPVDFVNSPHISPACLPDRASDFTGARCWTTGWGKDAFGDFGKYQNILKEVDVPIIGHNQCQQQLRNTRLGYTYQLNPGFICAGKFSEISLQCFRLFIDSPHSQAERKVKTPARATAAVRWSASATASGRWSASCRGESAAAKSMFRASTSKWRTISNGLPKSRSSDSRDGNRRRKNCSNFSIYL